MEINTLSKRTNIEQHKVLAKKYTAFERLIVELNKRDIPPAIAALINKDIDHINSFSGSNRDLLRQLSKAESEILKLIERELKLVTKNHYRKQWLALGMAAFGLPLGAIWGMLIGNMAFLAVGLPIGMAIGVGVGAAMDKKAYRNGKQLDVDMDA